MLQSLGTIQVILASCTIGGWGHLESNFISEGQKQVVPCVPFSLDHRTHCRQLISIGKILRRVQVRKLTFLDFRRKTWTYTSLILRVTSSLAETAHQIKEVMCEHHHYFHHRRHRHRDHQHLPPPHHGLFPTGSVPAHNGGHVPYRLLGPQVAHLISL